MNNIVYLIVFCLLFMFFFTYSELYRNTDTLNNNRVKEKKNIP